MTGLFNLGIGTIQALRIIRTLRPDAVVGFGGYASAPALFAGRLLHPVILLHEQNTVMGWTNRHMARHVDLLATSFDNTVRIPARTPVVRTGLPLRPEIAALAEERYSPPGPEGPFRILVLGGSQGAGIFADIVPEGLGRLPDPLKGRIELVQQCRLEDEQRVRTACNDTGFSCETLTFIKDIPERLKAAHLIISRAGAASVWEIAAAGRPALLVPLPTAADDHQTFNARALTESGGGWLLPQDTFSPDTLAEWIISLAGNTEKLETAAGCAHDFSVPDAAEKLADTLLETIEKNRPSP